MRALGVLLTLACVAACEGPAGPPGEVGEQGEQGPPGAPGMDGDDGASGLDVVVSTRCSGRVRNTSGALLYSLGYSIVEYTSGAVWVSCSVANGATESSSSTFFAPTQVGATSHGCTVYSDGENGTFGWWDFSLGSTGYSATYNDVDSTNNGFEFEFAGPSSTQDGCTTVEP